MGAGSSSREAYGHPASVLHSVKRIGHDERGCPVFAERLTSLPGSADQTSTLIQTMDDRTSRSDDIAVVDQPPAGPGPLAVIVEVTGRGYEGGVAITSGIAPDGTITWEAVAVSYLAVKAVPVVLATATGFVVGMRAGLSETAKDLKRVIADTRETIIAFRTCSCDDPVAPGS